MQKEFAYRPGFRPFGKVAPQIVGEHLEVLQAATGGEVRPSQVVEDARGGNSPLHPMFEWDDAQAAEQHRLDQARHLLRGVVIVYRKTEDENEPPKTVNAFVRFARPNENEGSYISISAAMSDDAKRAELLRRAWSEMQSWRRRYSDLTEFAGLFNAIEQFAIPFAEAQKRMAG